MKFWKLSELNLFNCYHLSWYRWVFPVHRIQLWVLKFLATSINAWWLMNFTPFNKIFSIIQQDPGIISSVLLMTESLPVFYSFLPCCNQSILTCFVILHFLWPWHKCWNFFSEPEMIEIRRYLAMSTRYRHCTSANSHIQISREHFWNIPARDVWPPMVKDLKSTLTMETS